MAPSEPKEFTRKKIFLVSTVDHSDETGYKIDENGRMGFIISVGRCVSPLFHTLVYDKTGC
jgi:hypothetical protein